MAANRKRAPKTVTRYTHDAPDPVTPETGHTDRLVDEEVVTLEMDNGWSDALQVVKVDAEKTVVVDLDPAVDPVLLWAGKRNRREVPVLPLQRNEIVSESRIARIIERARASASVSESPQGSFFADLERELRETGKEKRVEFYTHEEEWRNKLICGDSLEVMESLMKYEGLAGGVQTAFLDPPYGVGYNSNFQQRVDLPSNDERHPADDVVTVRAFRDTWALGVHSYLSYLADRLYLVREMLAASGSIFLQISEDNVHLVRSLLDEVFGRENFCGQIAFTKTAGLASDFLPSTNDYLLWYAKARRRATFNQVHVPKVVGGQGASQYTWIESPDGSEIRQMSRIEAADPSQLPKGWRIFSHQSAYTTGSATTTDFVFEFANRDFRLPARQRWRTTRAGMDRLAELGRLFVIGNSLRYKRYLDDFPFVPLNQAWTDTSVSGFGGGKEYVVQTNEKVVSRCVLMTSNEGDLVFDPTCGSGTTALAAERWGRRWITCDTSRVAVNVARRRMQSLTLPAWTMRGDSPASGFNYREAIRVTLEALANDKEPDRVRIIDEPQVDREAVRVAGPFETMTLGRYSIEDWKGVLVDDGPDGRTLENYVSVICRLYQADAEVGGGSGIIHAIVDSETGSLGISVGPLTGRVTAYQLNEAAREAEDLGLEKVQLLGWAFEANVGEVKERLERQHGVRLDLVMIRPDALADGLKVVQPEMLFSPLALPELDIAPQDNGQGAEWNVTLEGVTVFDRIKKTTAYHQAGDNYIAAWYLDEDYDGDCFVDCQMFFDFKKAPNLKSVAGVDVDADEFDIRFTSDPFPAGRYKRIAVKVVDIYGNESTMVRELSS